MTEEKDPLNGLKTVSDVARICGVTRQAVHYWLSKDKISYDVYSEKLNQGFFHAHTVHVIADWWLRENSGHAKEKTYAPKRERDDS